MKHVILFFGIMLTILSCGSGDLFEFLNRSIDDPITERPRIESFKSARTIGISWDFDKAADEYFVYRDTNPEGFFNTLCYSGRDLSFIDDSRGVDVLYYYALAKRKEGKLFPRSLCVMGIANDSYRDAYEDNDSLEITIADSNKDNPRLEFENLIIANIFYYRDGAGNEVEDIDWYWVTIPPDRTLNFRIEYPTGGNLDNNHVKYSEWSGPANVAVSGDILFTIKNCNTSSTIKYFQIRPNTDVMIKKIGTYMVRFVSLEPCIH